MEKQKAMNLEASLTHSGTLSASEMVEWFSKLKLPKVRGKKTYFNVPFAFDTEGSSFIEGGKKTYLCYSWQFGIGNSVTVGRDIHDFVEFLDCINYYAQVARATCVVYVHNLQYDWQVIRKLFSWDELFFVDSRKPLHAVWKNIEFRDSLILSGGRSLATIGKELMWHDVQKATGDLDYELVRTPITPISADEVHYMEMDIRVLLAYIWEKIVVDGSIVKIPATNTGYVRRALKRACTSRYENYMSKIDTLVMEPRAYQMMKLVQAGGFTHGNKIHRGEIVTDVKSWDIRSSYPAAMCYKYFPNSEPICVKPDLKYTKSHCVMFIARMTGVYTKEGYEFPLSLDKALAVSGYKGQESPYYKPGGYGVSNGRIVWADYLEYAFTELDWETYCDFYEQPEDMVIEEMWIMDRGYVPRPIIKVIADYYKGKTTLKGVKEKLLEYNISKNMINAIFGCMTMDPVREQFPFDYVQNDFYVDDDGNYMITEKPDIEEAVEAENQKKGRFLFYGWGVWVTAQARRNLMRCICAMGKDHVYSDTDSEKIVNWKAHEGWFRQYNAEIMKEISAAAERNYMSVMDFMPERPKKRGESDLVDRRQILGTFADEGVYDRFITFGAKRYLGEVKGVYHLTVAGLNKTLGCGFLCGLTKAEILKYEKDEVISNGDVPKELARGDPFEYFKADMEVPADYSGRMVMTYIDEPREGTVTDYLGNSYHFYVETGVHMEKSAYHMGVPADIEFLRNLDGRIEGSYGW